LLTVTTLGKENKSQKSSSCNFLHLSYVSCSTFISLSVKDQVSPSYKNAKHYSRIQFNKVSKQDTGVEYIPKFNVLKFVIWFRQLIAGLSPWRPWFVPRSFHVGFVVDKVALGQVFLLSPSVFPWQYHSIVALHTHIAPCGMDNRPIGGHSSET
jgi:hypothetical protein